MVNLRSWVSMFNLVFILLVLALSVNADNGDGNEVSPRCKIDLSAFLPPPYKNISAVCKPIWNNAYIIRHSQTSDNVLTIIVSTIYTTGWVGMGFSPDGFMVGASAMVGWVSRLGKAEVKQYYVQGPTSAEIIPDKGELPLTNVPPVVVLHDSSIYIAFQLKYEKALAKQNVLFAFSSIYPQHTRLPIHDDKTTMMFDFSTGSVSEGGGNAEQRKTVHGIMGLLGWGLILPVGAIMARYFRHKDPLWFNLHSIIQFVGFLFILANLITGHLIYSGKIPNEKTHRGIGIFAFVLACLQVMAFFLRPNKEVKIRRYWNWYHHWLGRLALFLGSLNIVLGVEFAGAKRHWRIGYGFLLAATLITVFVLEALAFLRRRDSKPSQNPAFQMHSLE